MSRRLRRRRLQTLEKRESPKSSKEGETLYWTPFRFALTPGLPPAPFVREPETLLDLISQTPFAPNFSLEVLLLHNTASWKYGRKQLFWVPCPASSRAPSSGTARCPCCRAGIHTGTPSTPCSGCSLPCSRGCCSSGRCTCCCCGCVSSAARRCASDSGSSCSRRSARSCGPSSGRVRQPAALSFFGVQTGPTASRRRCLLGVSASAKRSRHLCRTCCSRGTCSRGRRCSPGCRCFCRLPSGNLPGRAVPAAAGNGSGRPNIRPEQDDLLPCRSARRGPRHRQLFLHV